LEVFYQVVVKDGKLVVRHRKGEMVLQPLGEDKFSAWLAGSWTLGFSRDANNQINGFTLDGSRTWHLRFTRAEIKLSK
jgi:hypothetical protein